MQRRVLDGAMDPVQFRIVPTGKPFPCRNHVRCDVDCIDTVNLPYLYPCDRPRTATRIEHRTE